MSHWFNIRNYEMNEPTLNLHEKRKVAVSAMLVKNSVNKTSLFSIYKKLWLSPFQEDSPLSLHSTNIYSVSFRLKMILYEQVQKC